MEERLQNSAAKGDVEALYAILAEDPGVLEHIDQKIIVDTPLHIAVSAEKIHFVKEILNLKPSFAWKQNRLGLSPIHLALEKRNEELVKWFISTDSKLVRVKAKGMVTPLHYAAEIDDDFNLANFLFVCPSSIKDLTVKSETAVHVALKNGSSRAFKVLFGWLQRMNKEELLEWEDENGDTALHIATSTNQPWVIKLLIGYVKVNTKDKGDSTALDIFYSQQDSLDAEVGEILLRANAKRACELNADTRTTLGCLFYARPKSTTFVDDLSGELSRTEKIVKILRIGDLSIYDLPIEVRNVVLVVAILIATATYQAALSPPGGYWQDDANNLSGNKTVINTTTPTTSLAGQGRSQHRAGQMIMGSSQLYFFAFNSLAFCTSVCTILMVLVGIRFSSVLFFSTYCLLFAYSYAVLETFPSQRHWKDLVGGVLLFICVLAAYGIPNVIKVLSTESMFRKYGRRSKLQRGVFEQPEI